MVKQAHAEIAMERLKAKKINSMLKKQPYIAHVNGIFKFLMLERFYGKRDSRRNQVCPEPDDRHITPYVNDKTSCVYAHINKTYLRTISDMEPLVSKTHALIKELEILMGEKDIKMFGAGSSEENSRREMAEAARAEERQERIDQILVLLSEIRGLTLMVDESLAHHVEESWEILTSRISNYWKGILECHEGESLEAFPVVHERTFPSQEVYRRNFDNLIEMIDAATVKGGGEV